MTDPSRHRPMCQCGTDHRRCIDGRYTVTETGCWEWTGRRDPNGYGYLDHLNKNWLAHRMAYWALAGDFPSHLQLDHLCKNRSCINPDHLEPVTRKENIRRSDSPAAVYGRRVTCPKGHELIPLAGRPARHCARCDYEYRRDYAKTNSLEPGDPRHGTLYGYQRFGCRCDPCREAFNARRRAEYARHRESRIAKQRARRAAVR
jgi:hypothetical protein